MNKILDPSNVKEKEKTYLNVKKDFTKTIKCKITQKLKTLKDEGKLSYLQYIELKPQSETVPRIYSLSKEHKNLSDLPYRPIVDYAVRCT